MEGKGFGAGSDLVVHGVPSIQAEFVAREMECRWNAGYRVRLLLVFAVRQVYGQGLGRYLSGVPGTEKPLEKKAEL